MAAKLYRIQRSDHQGVVSRAFGGRVVSWSPWRTAWTAPTLEEAQRIFADWSRQGLSRWRIMYGAEVKKQSL